MQVNSIRLRNFRCYEDISLNLHNRLNVIVGINGTGKTAVLEALRIAIGSLFLGVNKYKDKISSPGINPDDARLSNLEPQIPVFINAEGEINEFEASNNTCRSLSWERSLETWGGKTRYVNAKDMVTASNTMQECIRDSTSNTTIPLIAYYSTDRFKKEKKDVGVEPDASRLRGYYNALDPLTNIKFFLDLYFTETLSELQNKKESMMLRSVNMAVMECIDNCESIKFDIKKNELIFTIKDTLEKTPFHMLSDGVRTMLAMVMEIAFRCYILNPHLKEQASKETTGVVLIDEIDLHLHPAWQKKVLRDLRIAFPSIQFIVTTHAPLVLGSVKDGKIISIKDNQAFDFPLQHGKDANYILNEMGTSEMDNLLKDNLKDYFILIEKGMGKEEEALKYRAILEQELGKEHTELQRADMMLSFF